MIRILGKCDLPEVMVLQECMLAALPDPRWYYHGTMQMFEQDMDKGLVIYGYYAEKRLAGIASCSVASDTAPVNYAEAIGTEPQMCLNFCDMMVDPDFRRQGIHGALCAQVEAYAVQNGCSQIICTIDPENKPSRRAFEKAGYQAGQMKPTYDGRPRIYYTKSLLPTACEKER